MQEGPLNRRIEKRIEKLLNLPVICKVERSDNCYKQFASDFAKSLFLEDDGFVIKLWIMEMERLGPEYIEDSKDWRDHPLEREWAGYRASCYRGAGRIIYRVIEGKVLIAIIEKITPNHRYKEDTDEAIDEKK